MPVRHRQGPLLLGLMVLAMLPAGRAGRTETVHIHAKVVAQCTLSCGNLAFGQYVTGQNVPQHGQVDVSYNCPDGLNITLNLSPGQSGDGANRRMRNPASGQELPYQLFQDAERSTVWGAGADGLTIGATPGGGARLVPIFGRIPAGQTIGAGSYSDTVILDLTVNG
jgi:spore coat protein U-like protein